LKLNGTYWLVVYADYVNTRIMGENRYTLKKNTESLVVADKEILLEVNTDKNKYMAMARDQNAGRSHNIKTDTFLLKGWKS
jgi:hypothetical protein